MNDQRKGNGLAFCSVGTEQAQKTILQVHEVHSAMTQILEHTQHLRKLDALEDIKDHLLRAATGKDHIETKTAMVIFKILGIVIIGLVIAIVFLLTGQHLGWFGLH